jgi:hypothetical protein
MEIPLMPDSDNESFVLSEDTMIEHEEEIQVRAVADTYLNPDEINLFLYEDAEDEILEEVEVNIAEAPEPVGEATKILRMEPEPEPVKQKAIQKSKATTTQELENELIESVIKDSNIIQTLYLLHEHYANHKTATKNEKLVMKGRILHQLSQKITDTKLKEFTQIINNFFN